MPPVKVVAISMVAAVQENSKIVISLTAKVCDWPCLTILPRSWNGKKWNENGSDVRHLGRNFVTQTLFYSLKSEWCRHVCALCLCHGFVRAYERNFNNFSGWNYWSRLLIKCMCYGFIRRQDYSGNCMASQTTTPSTTKSRASNDKLRIHVTTSEQVTRNNVDFKQHTHTNGVST